MSNIIRKNTNIKKVGRYYSFAFSDLAQDRKPVGSSYVQYLWNYEAHFWQKRLVEGLIGNHDKAAGRCAAKVNFQTMKEKEMAV